MKEPRVNVEGYTNVWVDIKSVEDQTALFQIITPKGEEVSFFDNVLHYYNVFNPPLNFINYLKKKDNFHFKIENILEKKGFYMNGNFVSIE